ncbi:unnamed protein product [Closterium sp. NIES-54]
MASTAESEEPQAATRRDLYEVLGVAREATDDEIKSAYKKLALRFHPDKNANDPEATDKFKEVAFAYSILSDPDKRHQYTIRGFDAVNMEDMDDSLDLSGLSTFNTAMVALFSKLGVPIKTSVSQVVLEEALSGTVTPRTLPLGGSISDRVEKQKAHFYSVTLTEEQAKSGLAVRATSSASGKFKLLYFDWRSETGGLDLSMQESSIKYGKSSQACLFFLGFQCYRYDPTASALEMARDPETSLFYRLDGLSKCEVNELKDGTHVFAVYGDNFLKGTSYTIEAVPVQADSPAVAELRRVEAELVGKKERVRKFEKEFRDAVAKYVEVVTQYNTEKEEVDDLLSMRFATMEMFTAANMGAGPGVDPSNPSAGSPSVNGRPGSSFSGSDDQQLQQQTSRSKSKKWFPSFLKTS